MADHDDDLFQHTSMTFGEHLEELRVALFKAVVALAIGFGIGLFFANRIVQLIQSPLEIALTQFYKEEAVEYFNSHVPESLQDNERLKQLVNTDGMEPQEVFIAPSEMLGELKKKYPKEFGAIELPAAKAAPGAATEKTGAGAATVADPATATDATATVADAAKPATDATSKPASDSSTSAEALSKDDMIRVFLWRPIAEDERLKVKSLNVQESFMIWLKAGFLAGAIISSPFVFYFIWQFIAAGLYPTEKRYVHVFLPFSVILFMSGAMLAFFFVFPPVLNFFFGITKSMGQGIEPRISEWLSFVLLLPLGFGISFQLPLVMLFLERIHVMNVGIYLSKWRIAVLMMAIGSMVLSPGGDPYSMMMMLVPLVGLYFGGIALCKWLPTNGPREAN